MENFKPFVMSEFPVKTFLLMSVDSYQFQFVVLAKFGILFNASYLVEYKHKINGILKTINQLLHYDA